MSECPEDLVKTVRNEETFLKFLLALSRDWQSEQAIEAKTASPPYSAGALGWENGTISAFLERASACGFAHLCGDALGPRSNAWRRAAEILLSGKYYE